MTLFSELTLRVGHAIRTNPWLRMLLGAVIITAGTLELILGIGHGRLIALGVLLLAGGTTAARARLTHPNRDDEAQPGRDDEPR
jgi:hypothetical protein